MNLQPLFGYTPVKIVGEGAFGKAGLYKRNSDNKNFVIKEVIIRSMTRFEMAIKEVSLLSSLSHPNIISYVEHIATINGIYIVMEYAERGSLDKYLEKQKQENNLIDEQDVLNFFQQIASGVAFIHSRNILHRDLKPANIFLTKNLRCKIGDFGISGWVSEPINVLGTNNYMSPELFVHKSSDKKSDVWALGCILHEMCQLEYTFKSISKIMECDYKPIPSKYSKELRILVSIILQKNPANRPRASKIHLGIQLGDNGMFSCLRKTQRGTPNCN